MLVRSYNNKQAKKMPKKTSTKQQSVQRNGRIATAHGAGKYIFAFFKFVINNVLKLLYKFTISTLKF